MQLNHRGFTLAELVVATSLGGILAILAGGVFSRAASGLIDRKGRHAAEQALRAGTTAIRALLEGGEETGPDVLSIAPAGVSARMLRGSGVLCDVLPAGVVARRSLQWWRAVREPVGGRDSVALGKLGDAGWFFLPLGADPVSRSCPDGSAGMALPVTLDDTLRAVIGLGSPVRVFEAVELRSYSSSGEEWIGIRALATGEPIQPLAGPLLRPGLRLEYLAQDGLAALNPGQVASVALRVTALRPNGRADSVAGWVVLKGGWK
jgi:prepilin-type N-terminal cleavage/methylation domain-containing protein